MKKALLILAVLVLFACSDNSNPEPEKSTNTIIPLAVGNTWIYEDGTQTITTIKITNKYKAKPVGYPNENDIYKFTIDDFGDKYAYAINIDKYKGIYVFEIDNNNIITPEYCIPDTPSDSTVWGGTIQWIAKNMSVTVPAGTFNCYVGIRKHNSEIITGYYCFGVGLIKEESNSSTIKLKSYSIK
jgi:hypothetical protein